MQAALLSGSDAPHPLFLLSYSSLASLCLLVPVVGALEPRGYATALQLHASNASFAPLLLLSCAAAFATNLSNFLVARELGALTAQVVGNAKNGESGCPARCCSEGSGHDGGGGPRAGAGGGPNQASMWGWRRGGVVGACCGCGVVA